MYNKGPRGMEPREETHSPGPPSATPMDVVEAQAAEESLRALREEAPRPTPEPTRDLEEEAQGLPTSSDESVPMDVVTDEGGVRLTPLQPKSQLHTRHCTCTTNTRQFFDGLSTCFVAPPAPPSIARHLHLQQVVNTGNDDEVVDGFRIQSASSAEATVGNICSNAIAATAAANSSGDGDAGAAAGVDPLSTIVSYIAGHSTGVGLR